MKVYIHFEDPIRAAVSAIIPLMFEGTSICDNYQEADLIFVKDKWELQELFDENKFFAVFNLKEIINLPENARWLPMLNYPAPMAEYFSYVQDKLSSLAAKIDAKENLPAETGKEFQPLEATEKSQRILVVDDKPENRQLAMDLLNKDHFVTLASGYGEGLKLLREYRYDVVLSDCQMLPETKNSPLSVESIAIGQTVHNGIFLVFHATKQGSRIAIVTDANHHNDWVSALLDDRDLQKPQSVNGQPVLLINHMGKRWDEALEAINAL